MRVFVHYDKEGQILSVVQVERMADDLEHPFTLTEEAQGVLELETDDPTAKQACHEIQADYAVDVVKKKLRKK
jgi:hypothetical protein